MASGSFLCTLRSFTPQLFLFYFVFLFDENSLISFYLALPIHAHPPKLSSVPTSLGRFPWISFSFPYFKLGSIPLKRCASISHTIYIHMYIVFWFHQINFFSVSHDLFICAWQPEIRRHLLKPIKVNRNKFHHILEVRFLHLNVLIRALRDAFLKCRF